jgi:dipeptidyl aminopeptidase/acylaminoacyl peptidase
MMSRKESPLTIQAHPSSWSLPSALRALRRALPLAFVAAMLLAPVQRASAEIIDFDPQNEEPAEILEADERELLATLSSTSFVYMLMEPSPSGRWVMAWVDGQEGLMDLESGEMVMLPEDTPGFVFDPPTRIDSALRMSWLGEDELGVFARSTYPPATEDELPTYEYHRVSIDLSGDEPAVESTELVAMADTTPNIMDVSADLNTMLIMRPPGGGFMPDPIAVTLGESPFQRTHALPDALPQDLPGLVGANPLGTLDVQQANFELVLMPMAGGEEVVLDLSGGAGDSVANVGFSPDGNRVSLLTRSMPGWDGDRQRDNDPPGEGLPNLASINVREALGLIAPEDNPLLWGTFAHVFDTTDGSVVKAFANSDLPQGMIADFGFSPSGERAILAIATRAELEGREHPTYAYPGGIELHVLDADLNIVQQVDCPGCDSLSAGGGFIDDDTMVFATPHELDTHVVRYDITDGSSTVLWDKPGSMFQVFGRPGGMLYSHMSIDRPMELYALGDVAASGDTDALDGASPRSLTSINSAAAAASEITFDEFTWTSSDGATLTGIVVHHISQAWPPSEPWPMVVWQQGGPGGQMVNDWGGSVESPYSLLPNIGIPVFIANAAGRTAQTPQFFTDMAEGTNFGQLDIAQIKEGVEQMIAEGMVDGDKVGVTGCSYGGYFTLQSIRTYPDFYAAANPQCSLVDLIEEFNFGYTPFISYLMGRTPFMEPAEYLADSPLFGSNQVSTPTLIFHGTNDFLPVPLINNLHDQLEENGTDVTFLRVAGEGHGLGRFENSQPQAVQMQVQFFREQLGLGDFERPERTSVFLPAVMNNYDAAPPAEGGN